MGASAADVLAAEREVLRRLAGGPKTVREIHESTYHAARQAWADKNGFTYNARNPDAAPHAVGFYGARTAREHGIFLLSTWHAYGILRRLENRGEVVRIRRPGGLPMLWKRADSGSAEQ